MDLSKGYLSVWGFLFEREKAKRGYDVSGVLLFDVVGCREQLVGKDSFSLVQSDLVNSRFRSGPIGIKSYILLLCKCLSPDEPKLIRNTKQ